MPRLKDITGQRFGLLTAIKQAAPIPGFHNAQWECLCDCGAATIADSGNLKYGRTKSCGAGKHRPKKRPPYKNASKGRPKNYGLWHQMLRRCRDPKHNDYHSYGGRGIRVCERWQTFSNFAADMGARPPGTTLDRFPNKNGNYEPGNVRWATPTEQANNTRNNRLLTALGKSMTVAQWGRETGLGQDCIAQRIRVLGWSAERAVSTPKRLPR